MTDQDMERLAAADVPDDDVADRAFGLFYLRGPADLLTDAEWAPRGYRIVTAERGGRVREYSCDACLPLRGLQELARARLAAVR